jgi:hypothetical protein
MKGDDLAVSMNGDSETHEAVAAGGRPRPVDTDGRRPGHRWGQSQWLRWAVVCFFAAGMAWAEAAAVLYIRTVVGRIDPYQQPPLPLAQNLGQVELVREVATLVMLFTVGWLAGRTWRSRLAYALVAFGVWDILYYVFLSLISGWPRSLLDWDILFLLPLPWWGPVITPMLIAALMIAGGTLVSQFDLPEQPLWPNRPTVALNIGGACLALYVFMSDALGVIGNGEEALENLLPDRFNWPLFVVALGLMAVPVLDLARQVRGRLRDRPTEDAVARALFRRSADE